MKKIKTHVKKGDTVTVISGDDKGKSGKILQLYPAQGRALVEGVNIVKKHIKQTQYNTESGVVELEASIAISNLKLEK